MHRNRTPARLSDLAILIVEDEYYLAIDLAEQIERSGGSVVGPFATAEEGIAALADTQPACALIDINTGDGPSFGLADALTRLGIPFVFMTGYDAEVIPERFAGIVCVQKPANGPTALEALENLTRDRNRAASGA